MILYLIYIIRYNLRYSVQAHFLLRYNIYLFIDLSTQMFESTVYHLQLVENYY